MKQHGIDRVARQPDFSLVENADGTVQGHVEYVASNVAEFPRIGSSHPADGRCECYAREIKWEKLGLIRATLSYFGLVAPRTEPVIAYTPATDKDSILSHPDFFHKIAGTAANPLNGAKFDQETGEFIDFCNFDPGKHVISKTPEEFTPKTLLGVHHYLTPSTQISVTYWQSSVPTLMRRMSIVDKIPGFKAPPDVKEFMLLDFPYRQVGSHYQVTELYLGSGPNGFSRLLYPGKA